MYLYIQGAQTPAQFEEQLAGQMAVTTVRVGDERAPILPATGPAVPFDGRVLLVGEGNFSFTASNLALGRNAASNVTATAYSPDGSYPDEVRARAEELRRAGADVQFQVDARALPADLAGGAMFDTIVFQFPHPGGLRGAVSDRGRVLLRGFFTSATSRLNPGGQIAVTLRNDWYNRWKFQESAAKAGLRLASVIEFRPEHYPRYSHVTTARGARPPDVSAGFTLVYTRD